MTGTKKIWCQRCKVMAARSPKWKINEAQYVLMINVMGETTLKTHCFSCMKEFTYVASPETLLKLLCGVIVQ